MGTRLRIGKPMANGRIHLAHFKAATVIMDLQKYALIRGPECDLGMFCFCMLGRIRLRLPADVEEGQGVCLRKF